MSRYVALGSSMAAGPGIRPSADGAPFRSGRSGRNYAHVAAEKLGLDLFDVTFSGATTANVLTDRHHAVDTICGPEGPQQSEVVAGALAGQGWQAASASATGQRTVVPPR